MRSKLNLLFAFFFLFLNLSKAQYKSTKGEVSSKGYGESFNQAYSKALNQVYVDLISEFGGGINVGSTSLSERNSSPESSNSTSYRSMILGLEGLVSDLTIVETSHKLMAEGRYFEVTLKAKATVHSELRNNTSNYKIAVKGVKPKYKIGDQLEFDIGCKKQMYIYVYELVEDRVAILYPDPRNKDALLKTSPKRLTRFPPEPHNFTAALNDEANNEEIFSLVLVASEDPFDFPIERNVGELITSYTTLESKKDIKVIKVAIAR
jgi:hypothetical protein